MFLGYLDPSLDATICIMGLGNFPDPTGLGGALQVPKGGHILDFCNASGPFPKTTQPPRITPVQF